MSSIAAEKALLREQVRASGLSDCARKRSDSLLFARFLDLPQVKQARTLLLFWGVRSEPDTTGLFGPLSDAGKRLALPHCLPHRQMEAREYRGRTHLAVSPYGIPEPDESCPILYRDALDLILVPNLCCDRRLFRLGHGGGYYDRYLTAYRGVTVALCRDALLTDVLPVDRFDVPLDFVLTEFETLRFC